MTKELKEKLEANVIDQLGKLEALGVGGELHASAVDDIVSMTKVINEIDKDEAELEAARAEIEAKKAEIETKQRETKRDTIIKAIEAGVGVGTFGLGVAGFFSREKWLQAGFELERTGTFTVQTLKTLFTNVLKK